MKRDSYTAWRKGKRVPSYNSWRKGKRGPSYNSWRKGKRSSESNDPSKNILADYLLAKQGFDYNYYEPSFDQLFYQQKRYGEPENNERGQEEESLLSSPMPDQLFASTGEQREKRETQVDSKSPEDNKEPTDNGNIIEGDIYGPFPQIETVQGPGKEKSSKIISNHYSFWRKHGKK